MEGRAHGGLCHLDDHVVCAIRHRLVKVCAALQFTEDRVTRDAVRLLVSYRSSGELVHTSFSELPRFLDAGDLVVVNTSGTLAAAVDAVSSDGEQ